MSKYAIGLDFGTESARAVLVELATGSEAATAVFLYPDGVIDTYLPGTSIKLEHDWALQNPQDYLHALYNLIPEVIKKSEAAADDIIGIGVDFTACTVLPVDEAGKPLCLHHEFRNNPHSWVKLWKHHAAQNEANRINKVANERNEEFLARYGGKISPEWLIPKVWQILNEAPEIYSATHKFVEAGDWVVQQLTGGTLCSSCMAGYKSLWSKQQGFPKREFLKALDVKLENLSDKLSFSIIPVGSKAGGLLPEVAAKIGLHPNTAVAVATIDAHASLPAMGVYEPGKMVLVMGTSLCHMLVNDKEVPIPGISGVVEDGILPGYFGYEAGQAAVGDIFSWFINNALPEHYIKQADATGKDIFQLIEEEAAKILPGESGLLALDWWNGNRSILGDANLSGLILGYNLRTKPAEVYRALMEATAFGTNKIIRNFVAHGIEIHELYACGGLAEKNRLLLQIYADVSNLEIKTSAAKHICALGAALLGAVAAGSSAGGYDSIREAAEMITSTKDIIRPNKDNHAVYQRLYNDYEKLHDYFGLEGNQTMLRLKQLQREVEAKLRYSTVLMA